MVESTIISPYCSGKHRKLYEKIFTTSFKHFFFLFVCLHGNISPVATSCVDPAEEA